MNKDQPTANHSKHYLRQRDLLNNFLPFSATTLWRKVKSGEFPAPVKLGLAISAWRTQEVLDWLNAQGAAK